MNRGVTICVTPCMSNFMILITLPNELKMVWFFAWTYLCMFRMCVNFSGIFECISYLIDNFSPIWPNCWLLWHMFPFHLWNSHTLLDGHEILHGITRHPHLCHGFSPIHLSYAISDLWIFQVDAWLVDFFEHVQNCFDFLIFIDCLPLVQMGWNLTCLHAMCWIWSWFIWWFLENV